MALDLLAAFEQEPPALDFIWSGFLAGTVGALIAPGATGKSFWALQAAMAVACKESDGDLLQLRPTRSGRVIYMAGEDPAAVLSHRVHALGKHLSPNARASIATNLALEPMMGVSLDLMNPDCFKALIQQVDGYRLVVLDTLSRMHQMDENSNGDMSQLITRLESLAANTGAAVLYLHHASKGSARDGSLDQQQAARGASALIDNIRWCGYIVRMGEEEANQLTEIQRGSTPIGNSRRSAFVRFGVSKQNYGTAIKDQWFERQEGGVLHPVQLMEPPQARERRRFAHGY